VQGDHGGQEEAGADLDARRPGHRPLPGGPGRGVVEGRVGRGPPAADQGRDRHRRGRGRQGPGRLPGLPQARLTVAPIKEIPMAEVLVLVDHVDGTVRKTTAEMLTGASRLGEPSAVWIGPADKAQASAPLLARFGAHKVYVVDDPQVTEYLVAPTVEVLAELVGRSSPAAVLLPSSPDGKEVAARLAVRTGSGIITDAIDVQPAEGGVRTVQSVFAGSYTVTSVVSHGSPVITVKPNSLPVRENKQAGTVEPLQVEIPESAKAARITGRTAKEKSGRPSLTEASIVVS